jgi:hypothetical protein
MVLYTALGLGAVVVIFASALRFVNSAKAKNVQMKWQGRSPNKAK